MRPGSLSLERKLPLLISILLVVIAGGLTAAGYHEVRQATELRGIERLQRMASQLAEMSGNATQQRLAALRRVAADSAIVAHLAAPDVHPASDTAVVAALRRLSISPADTSIIAELRPAHEASRVATRPELANDDEPINALIAKLSRGPAALGDFYRRGDSVFFWVGAPVTGNGRILGYVLLRRTVASSANTERAIRDLTGSDSVSILFASDSGTTWASMTGRPVTVPSLMAGLDDGPNVLRYTRGDGSRYIAVFAQVPNTPVRLIAETPYTTFLERPSAYLRRSIMVALVMVVLGILGAWMLSRHITRPLRDLTDAADAISAGNYGHRAAVVRRDETGKLADAFNTMAAQVQRSHDVLERQIAESRTLATRLDEANRAKADFLATMSHELRTPLNAIGGYVDLMELGVRGPITNEQRRDLDRVRYNQRHLLALIGNILDFTRLDAQKLPFDIGDVPVGEVVAEVVAGLEPLLDEKRLRHACLGCDVPIAARADRARLEQILLNLLSNSIRFTLTGGLITVEVIDRDNVVEIAVTDTGIGVPRDKLELIFEPFVQVAAGLTRTVGGTGLGLTISRSLARGMGGDLTAASDGESGASFSVTLPAAVAQPALEPRDAVGAGSS